MDLFCTATQEVPARAALEYQENINGGSDLRKKVQPYANGRHWRKQTKNQFAVLR